MRVIELNQESLEKQKQLDSNKDVENTESDKEIELMFI